MGCFGVLCFCSGFEGVLILGFWVVFRDLRVCCFRALGVFGI